MSEHLHPTPYILPFVESDVQITKRNYSTLKRLDVKSIDRIGCIPYTVIDNKIYFLFGKSTRGSISDFGGGRKKNEGLVSCIKREMTEEFGSNYLTKIVEYVLQKYGNRCTALHKESKITWMHAAPDYNVAFRSLMILVPIPKVNGIKHFFEPNVELENVMWIEASEFDRRLLIKTTAPPVTPFLEYMLFQKKWEKFAFDLPSLIKKYNFIYQ